MLKKLVSIFSSIDILSYSFAYNNGILTVYLFKQCANDLRYNVHKISVLFIYKSMYNIQYITGESLLQTSNGETLKFNSWEQTVQYLKYTNYFSYENQLK